MLHSVGYSWLVFDCVGLFWMMLDDVGCCWMVLYDDVCCWMVLDVVWVLLVIVQGLSELYGSRAASWFSGLC